MQLDPVAVDAYLSRRHAQPVQVLSIAPLSDRSVLAATAAKGETVSLKAFGYGRPLLITYRLGDEEQSVVLHTAPANQFGHETRADRAASMLLAFDTYNSLPRHAPALDVGVFTPAEPPDRRLVSLASGDEFFLLTRFITGTPYAHDLQQLRDSGQAAPRDRQRAARLAAYLAEIHAVKRPPQGTAAQGSRLDDGDAALYRRRIRDTVGSGEGIIGLIDSYPAGFDLASPQWFARVEKDCIDWRWRLKPLIYRLRQVHGDFHPFNIFFTDDLDFLLLDRSRGAWGEPADDVGCLAINYLFFSLQRSGELAPPFSELWDEFWNVYLQRTGDAEMLSVLAPFLAWRALVLASPVWYNTARTVRRALLNFIENVLAADTFDPADVNAYLQPPARTGESATIHD